MVSMDKKEASYRGPDLKLFVRDVRDRQRKKRAITVRSWSTVKDVKDIIQQQLQVPPSAQRLYFGPLLTSGGELPNHRTLHDAGIYRSGETLLLDIKNAGNPSSSSAFSLYSLESNTGNDVCISSCMMDSAPKSLKTLVQEARRGFAMGLKPELVLDGSGGTYFLHDARKNKIAVFKPADEEPYAENNPRGYLRTTAKEEMALREGVAPGEACIREVAAYLLDHNGVCDVPMTTLAEARHPAFNTNGARLKVSEGGATIGSHTFGIPSSPVKPSCVKKAGSFQEFVRCECTMDDISPSKISVEEVHKIAILDIRIMNADRNSANLLVRRLPDNTLSLVPIDHGYCLRSVSDVSWMDWCWLDWPQIKQPLSDKLKKYVLDLDIEKDARLLSERLNICQEAVDYFRASSSLLKAGVRAGLTLYEIAIRCCRNDNLAVVPSMLEKLIDMAADLASAAIENERWHHTAASRAIVEQLTPNHKRRSSMLSRMSSDCSGGHMPKSVSSAEFLAFTRDSELTSSLSEAFAGRDSPAMAQSSASSSDSSSDDNFEKEEGDCEEWAASIIMDVSVDQLIQPRHRNGRSGSISDDASSDSGLSCSPKGFWHVRPSSSPLPPADDDCLSWCPSESPRSSFGVGCDASDAPLSAMEDDSPDCKGPTVSFAPMATSPGPFIAPKALAASAFKENANDFGEGGIPLLHRSESGMSRSKSYSALSVAMSSAAKKSSLVSSNPHPATSRASISNENYEAYRKYFNKFIDLVITREISVASNYSKDEVSSWSSNHGFYA